MRRRARRRAGHRRLETMTRKLAVAALAAAALAFQGAFLYAVVAAPLSNAVGTRGAETTLGSV